jgi:hypothetical protein
MQNTEKEILEKLPTIEDLQGTNNSYEKPISKSENKKSVFKNINNVFTGIFNGNFLINDSSTKQAPFIFFLSIVAMFYIANGYYAESLVRNINKTNKQIKELHSQYIYTKSELMQESVQSSIVKKTQNQNLNLIESTQAPNKIVINTKENQDLEKVEE